MGFGGAVFGGFPGGTFGRFLGPRNPIINNELPKRSYELQWFQLLLLAVDEAVLRLGGGAKVARIAHPCFIDAAPDFPLSMPSGTTRGDVLAHTLGASKVPPLGDRWTRDGVAFGDFLATTFSHYYDWKDDNSGA